LDVKLVVGNRAPVGSGFVFDGARVKQTGKRIAIKKPRRSEAFAI
jgi:hypothetical protein